MIEQSFYSMFSPKISDIIITDTRYMATFCHLIPHPSCGWGRRRGRRRRRRRRIDTKDLSLIFKLLCVAGARICFRAGLIEMLFSQKVQLRLNVNAQCVNSYLCTSVGNVGVQKWNLSRHFFFQVLVEIFSTYFSTFVECWKIVEKSKKACLNFIGASQHSKQTYI